MTISPETPDQPLADKDNRLVWIDLEMTGLDVHKHTIVEIAALITDANLNILGQGLDLVIHADEQQLAHMDSYVTDMHTSSGLLAEIQRSTLTLEEAEQRVIELIHTYCGTEHPMPLAGNSIAVDRSFIREYMPKLDSVLHYRMIDVSSFKELAKRWQPQVYYHQPQKALSHRALTDIVESVRELAYYREALLKESTDAQSAQAASDSVTEAYQHFL
ncbi:oligoribonuclease [Corynebacterium sp. sy017]|uniref:oligoribonuclease n=1 Tax=unclassified Corynebacterium TaxID=2624378 RepID=UPI0011854E20|nr:MULTISPECIES: oligoribonuclease [unclassified Corynebacterium]MBP3088149.1 oligoribonuclease [Corynebacterium sp. sy017]TSD92661.1 oligoribonuclease [Corynebacterium sp. SY003]